MPDKTDRILNQLRTGEQQAAIRQSEDRRINTDNIINQLSVERKLPIAEDMFIPNLSGDLSKGKGAARVFTGLGSPADPPDRIGDIYINITDAVLYVSMGTSAATDWKGVLTNE